MGEWINAVLNRHGERLALAGAALIAVFTVLVGALAPAPTHGGGHGTAGAHGAGPKMCARYTDGCVLCPTAKYGPGCSTPGPACLRGAWYCAERG